MTKLVGILGSVTPPGRSLRALEFALDAARALDPQMIAGAINLADYRISFADGRPPEAFGDDTGKVVAEIASADAILLMSPVYRGSFSGSLKNLLDHLPVEALRGKPCGIVAVGATQYHYLGVDWHLRDVLAWFGALLAPTSVYLSSADFTEGRPGASAQKDLRALVSTLLRMLVLKGAPMGPEPLAARRS